MSIEKTTVQHRKFVVKAGMTAEDVKKSKDATALQKSMQMYLILTVKKVSAKKRQICSMQQLLAKKQTAV